MDVNPPPEPIPGARLLFSIDPAVAYLNHGSFGAVPTPVQRQQQRLRDEMEANPQRFFTTLWERVGHARNHLSTFLGADPASTAFVSNVTAAVSIVLRSLRLGSGDEVVTTSYGYGAVDLAVDHITSRVDATHVTVPLSLSASDDDIVAAVTESITTGRTRLVILDHVTSMTARVMPVTRLVAAARARHVPVMVDAAHAPGAHDVNVDAIGADFWVGNLHKWMYAPRPTAVLSVAATWRERIEPPIVSWADRDGFPANLEMGGTLDYTAWLAAPTGLYVLRTLGVDRVRAHNAQLAAYGQRVVGAALGLLSPSELPNPGGATASMRILPLPRHVATTEADAIALRNRIADELRVVVPVHSWFGRGLLRLSAQVYNHADEYDRLATGLSRVLASLA
ncbi:MAG TPA: aminotransferase class V-fold PLP-dependent enzyme [Micromonosporaceae bacterium]|jgi:isopenicillin-N epimerase|nr:aminotransferase class V-fold PLP-dependent enzyme [Micromonosporaceae bacterium]